MGRINGQKAGFEDSKGGKGAEFEPRPGGNNLISKVYNTLRSRPVSLGSILGLGDFHNVLEPYVPSDHNNQESKLFPTLREPIHASFPSDPEHIPAAVEDNGVPELER